MSHQGTPSPKPQYIYKILPSAPQHPLPLALPLSELDRTDSFIHSSIAEQVPGTCARFFTSQSQIWLLRIRLTDVESNVKWEQSGSGVFPHIYNQALGHGNVESVMQFDRDSTENWKDAFKKAGFE